MARWFLAVAGAALLFFWPWRAQADHNSPTMQMYQAMEWCLPETAIPGRPELDGSDEGLLVTIESRDFMLITMNPEDALSFTTVKHPISPSFRIGFNHHRYPGPSAVDRTFMQLAAGCFVLSTPPSSPSWR